MAQHLLASPGSAIVSLSVAAALGAGSLLGGCSKSSSEPAPADSTAMSVEGPAREGQPKAGDPAPDFTAVAHTGERVQLAELRGKVVVLYFYPKDGTPGCTTEARQFSASHAEFASRGAVVLGVSTDDGDSHRSFAEEHTLPFLLLSDEDRTLAKAYGVGGFLGMSKRVTFLIGKDGKIARVYPSVNPDEHAAEILRDIDAL